MTRSHDHDIAHAARDQLHPAEQERAHQNLAEVAVGLHEREENVAVHLDHCAWRGGADARESTATGEHVDFAGELPRSKHRQGILSRAPQPDDLGLTLGHEEEARRLLTGFHQHVALRDPAHATVPRDARHLRRRESGKHLLRARRRRDGDGRRHRARCRGHGLRLLSGPVPAITSTLARNADAPPIGRPKAPAFNEFILLSSPLSRSKTLPS